MTIAHHQTIINKLKEALNKKNKPPKTIKEVIPLGKDIEEFLSQFHYEYVILNIGGTLVIKSKLDGNDKKRWVLMTRANTPYWRELNDYDVLD